jgi:hypothetical protein
MTPNPSTDRQPIPWLWLGLGALATVIFLGVAAIALTSFLTQAPEGDHISQDLTIIRLTAPPPPTATTAIIVPVPTVAPTSTPVPTPDFSVAPPEVTAGYYAEVVETGGVGVTVRNGPSTSNVQVGLASEGSIIFVLEGPEAGGEYQWWRIRLTDGTEGWVAGDFLTPSAAP